MILCGLAKGRLKRGYTLVEATSGNTGIALSMVAAVKGYKMLVVMPEHMTGERIRMMSNLGASICLTPKNEGFEGAVEKADKIAKSDEHYFLTDQFRNPDNTMAHYHTTGKEIVQQAGNDVDCFVEGVGTGGTLMGTGAAVFVVMAEHVVDCDEHLAGDCDEGSVVSSTFHDS